MGLTREEIEARKLEQSGVEKNMRIIFSNLNHLRKVDKRGSLERRILKVREEWKNTGVFKEWMMETIDTCYEAVMRGAGYAGTEEVRKKKWR